MIEVDVSKGIDIGGFHYTVDTTDNARRDCLANSRYGSCSFVNQQLSLDKQYTPERVSEVFLHEAIEAINEHHKTELDHDTIERVTMGLHQVMESLGVRFVP